MSPPTISWNAVQATYRSVVPIARVASEVWRAAANDPDANWVAALSDPVIAALAEISATAENVEDALDAATRFVALNSRGSFAAEIAKGAIVSAIGAENRQSSFMRDLFELSTDYLVSRDLAGFVGPRYRNRTVQ